MSDRIKVTITFSYPADPSLYGDEGSAAVTLDEMVAIDQENFNKYPVLAFGVAVDCDDLALTVEGTTQ